MDENTIRIIPLTEKALLYHWCFGSVTRLPVTILTTNRKNPMILIMQNLNRGGSGTLSTSVFAKPRTSAAIIAIMLKKRNPEGVVHDKGIVKEYTRYINSAYIRKMWLIFHFYLMSLFEPNRSFHLMAASLLFLRMYWIKNVQLRYKSGLGLYCMYYGYSLYNHLMEFTFAPWYCITLFSLRDKDYYVFLGAVFVLVHLYGMAIWSVIGHVCMNVGRVIKTHRTSALMHIVVHLALFITTSSTDVEFGASEVLTAFSALLCVFFDDKMDDFSLAMLFTSSKSYTSFFLHVLEFDWYEYYRNNHFLPVYNGANWIVTLILLIPLLKIV
jgi:hypothetical protein